MDDDKYFFKGFIFGVVSMLLVAGIFFGVNMLMHVGSMGTENADGVNNEIASSKDIITSEKFIKKYNTICNYLDRYYLNEKDVKSDEISDGLFGGMLDSINDRYAEYYNKEEYAALMESTQGKYGGIGAYVSQNQTTGEVVIVNPFEGAPADKAGIKSGDIITKIDDESVAGLSLDEVTSLMKGEAGTDVKIRIYRKGEFIDINVTREIVDVPTVTYELIAEYNIGYIYISAFDEVTAAQFREAVDDLEEKGADGLVVDLRNNGGGLLKTAIDILDRMLPKGMVLYTETKNGRDEEFFSDDKEKYEKPYAVLINNYSASASEVFAGAVQDYGYGTIVGTTSFGKGVVQTIMPLVEAGDGSAIKITTSKYYTPKGRNIDGIGIEPDVKVELDPDKEIESGGYRIDTQLQEALKIVMEKSGK